MSKAKAVEMVNKRIPAEVTVGLIGIFMLAIIAIAAL